MNHTKLFIFILLSLVCSYANVVEDIHAFKRCHYTRQNIRKFYYKNDKAWIQIADSLFSYKVPLNCSNITFESVENDNLHNRLCRQPYGKMACYLVAIDVLSESRFLLLSYPAGKNHSGFYLKDSNGKDKQLKGSMLWGIGRKCMVMRENVVVIFYRNKKKNMN